MASLPFKVVAILEPSLSLTEPHGPRFDRQMQSELKAWLAKLKPMGADVVYARTQRMQAATAQDLLQAIAGEIPLLAPATAFDPGLPALGWHHPSYFKEVTGPGPWLRGRSCHSPEDLQAAEGQGMDYAFLSPVFSTATHPEALPLGLEAFAQACRQVEIPVIALGGVRPGNANACLEAGAAGWAAIGAFRS